MKNIASIVFLITILSIAAFANSQAEIKITSSVLAKVRQTSCQKATPFDLNFSNYIGGYKVGVVVTFKGKKFFSIRKGKEIPGSKGLCRARDYEKLCEKLNLKWLWVGDC